MRRRLVLVVAATTSLVMLAFAVPLAALVRDVAHDRAITAAERDAAALAPVLAATDDAQLVAAAVQQTRTGADGRLAVLTDGAQVGDQATVATGALALARDRRQGFTRHTADGIEIYSPVVTGGETVSVVRARLPDRLLDDGVLTAWAALGAVGTLLVVAACALADRLARSLTRDAGELAATARALAGGAVEARAAAGSVPEIADVAVALNGLADRIDELRVAERERVADLSHRLRTPLTALRLEADRAGVPPMSEAVDRLEQAVDQLVRQARRPLADRLVAETCDLAAVVRKRGAFWDALAEDDGRPVERVLPAGPVPVHLGRDEAAAAVDALLDNVFSHTPDGTPYAVVLERHGERARLVVEDEGPGMVDPVVAGARGASGRASTGLGLDIARHAAVTAGGTLTIDSGPGQGCRVTIDVPTTSGPPTEAGVRPHP